MTFFKSNMVKFVKQIPKFLMNIFGNTGNNVFLNLDQFKLIIVILFSCQAPVKFFLFVTGIISEMNFLLQVFITYHT